VEPSRIIYANPCKTNSFIKYAAQNNVDLMTFDNEVELHKVKAIFPHAKMVIRIRCDDVSARCPLGVKFGVEPDGALPLLKTAKQLGIDVVGVSFHVGSGCEDAQAYQNAIKESRRVFDWGEELGYQFDLLDLGGGYPGQPGTKLSFDQIAGVINSALDQYFPVGCGTRIIAEPGRYYVASAFTLAVNIIAKRTVQPLATADSQESAYMYYVNDGVYGSFNCCLYDHAVVEPAIMKETGGWNTYRSSVWGPTCDGLDRIVENCQLPLLDVGDWLVFENMGAYTVAAASTFNGFQKPTLLFVISNTAWLFLQEVLPTLAPMTIDLPCLRSGYDISVEDSILPEGMLGENLFSEISVIDV
jgi:ornithine decarboxylase